MFTSCAELVAVVNQAEGVAGTVQKPTEQENIDGLKNALTVFVTNSVLHLNKQGGYFQDQLIKILFSKETQPIVDNIKLVPGGEQLVNNFVLRLNRAAEDPAIKAKPIFVIAISNMSISDAWTILTEGEQGANNYLRKNTYAQLQNAFLPNIKIVG